MRISTVIFRVNCILALFTIACFVFWQAVISDKVRLLLSISIVVLGILYFVIKEVEQEEAVKSHQRYQTHLEEEKVRQAWLEEVDKEYEKARALVRTDEEIKKYAQKHYSQILPEEKQRIADYEKKISEGRLKKLKESEKGEMILKYWEEPLKEINEAKRFVTEGGPEKLNKEARLAQELTEAEIIKLRHGVERDLRKTEEEDGE
jgi:hypothetical protein